MHRSFAALLVTLVLLTGSAASAEPIILFATLTNAQENPPTVPTTVSGAPRPASFGVAMLTLDELMTSLSLTATVFNIDFTGTQTPDLNDNLLAAHIHASATLTPTTNAPVVWGFIGTPFNDTNPIDVVVTPFLTGAGGFVTTKWDLPEGNNTNLAAQLPNILAGRSYLNFHTVQFPGGEIRGGIEPVPEPGTMVMVGLGMAALMRQARRRKQV
jgi:hypothetical protein